ncbi:MAG TPA: hypothetical protein VF596_00690 [Pyrinomonadaceae bacterium]|jgi:Mg/Co/Ni transporter MgtE
MSESKRLVVTTSEDRSISDIEKELTDNGFVVDEVFDAAGSITGKVTDDDAIDRLREIRGVTDVSPEPPPIDIGPPGAHETW